MLKFSNIDECDEYLVMKYANLNNADFLNKVEYFKKVNILLKKNIDESYIKYFICMLDMKNDYYLNYNNEVIINKYNLVLYEDYVEENSKYYYTKNIIKKYMEEFSYKNYKELETYENNYLNYIEKNYLNYLNNINNINKLKKTEEYLSIIRKKGYKQCCVGNKKTTNRFLKGVNDDDIIIYKMNIINTKGFFEKFKIKLKLCNVNFKNKRIYSEIDDKIIHNTIIQLKKLYNNF